MESLLRSLVSKFVSPFSALALVSIGAQFSLPPLLLPDLPESSLDLLSLCAAAAAASALLPLSISAPSDQLFVYRPSIGSPLLIFQRHFKLLSIGAPFWCHLIIKLSIGSRGACRLSVALARLSICA